MYNQYNPYQISGGIKRINWSNILNNTQKTLNVINQAIPIIYQVKPLVTNAKTLFRIADAKKKVIYNSFYRLLFCLIIRTYKIRKISIRIFTVFYYSYIAFFFTTISTLNINYLFYIFFIYKRR